MATSAMNVSLTPDAVARKLAQDVYQSKDIQAALQTIDMCIAPGAVLDGLWMPAERRMCTGPEDYKKIYLDFKRAFPDLWGTVSDVASTGDLAFVRFAKSGYMSGDWMGHPAVNRVVKVNGVAQFRVRDGKIVQGEICWNLPALEKELGVGTPVATGTTSQQSQSTQQAQATAMTMLTNARDAINNSMHHIRDALHNADKAATDRATAAYAQAKAEQAEDQAGGAVSRPSMLTQDQKMVT